MATNTEIPVNFAMLLDAIHGCGEAVGQALALVMLDAGSSQEQIHRVCRILQTAAEDYSREGPDMHCMTGIVTGMLGSGKR